jgi:hypothetical protein
MVFGIIEGDDAVGKGKVEYRERACGTFQVRVVGKGGIFGDFIPGVPDRPCQNLATTAWSAVRVVLVFCPRLFTSLSARAYAWLSSAGGGAGRNCAPFFSTKGVTFPQVVNTGAAKFGGVG